MHETAVESSPADLISSIQIQNFKSISNTTLELGKFNVLIGENGCGKSNLIEAIVMASASSTHRLHNENLALRGVRVTSEENMRSKFNKEETINIKISSNDKSRHFVINLKKMTFDFPDIISLFKESIKSNPNLVDFENFIKSVYVQNFAAIAIYISDFTIYAPEDSALRIFQQEGQLLPLGRRGEGLFSHLKALRTSERLEVLREISNCLDLIDWFDGFDVPEDLAPGENSLRIRDRYLTEQSVFDQRSANEGFLYLLFYATLFISPDTPKFFAIDNIDASLNPKLCAEVTRLLVRLAKKHGKQVIMTTHNPAILDGLDLSDEEQRLLVVSRSSKGHTQTRRVQPPRTIPGQPPMRLSEAFLRGHIGGLPRNF